MFKCEVCGLTSKETRIIFYKRLKYLCNKHYDQMCRFNYVFNYSMFDKNEIHIQKDCCEMFLYSRRGILKASTLFDRDDLKRVNKHKWHLAKKGYVETRIDDKLVKFHQFIIGRKEGFEIDHINHNPLDNRKNNLRHVTHQENMLNTYRKKGGKIESLNA